MKLLVLGASGGCGRWVVRLAAARGHTVTALAREGATVESPTGVAVVRGDPLDVSVLERIVPGQEVVISCLGLRRAGRSPWAPLRSPADLTTRIAERLVPIMRRAGVPRLVAISAAGVAESFDRLSRPVKLLVSSGNVAVAYRDLASMEQRLGSSGLDWLAVRPVTLVNGAPSGRARPVERYALFSRISRGDLASWMLTAAERPEPFDRHTVILGR